MLLLGFRFLCVPAPPNLVEVGGFFFFDREKDPKKMESKLYVGNLSYSTNEDMLRELFAQAGTVVEVTLIKDRDSGRSKGFAFVEMSNQSEAEQAIKIFNGYSLDNRELRVSVARPREERPSSGYDSRRSSGGYNKDRRRSSGGGTRRY